MKILKFGVIIILMLIVVILCTYSWAQKPERPLRAVIPPEEKPEAEEPAPKAADETVPPPAEKEEPAKPAAEETGEPAAKTKPTPEAEEEKKQRDEYLQAAQELVEKLEFLRVTAQFGGDTEEFRKRLLEAGFALYRAKSKARGSVSQAASLGHLEAAANNFVRAKDAWEQARLKKEEAERAYRSAEQAFPESERRYLQERRETALGTLSDIDTPWAKEYLVYKQRGDAAKRESESLMQSRDSYLNAAYSSLEAGKEALKAEGK